MRIKSMNANLCVWLLFVASFSPVQAAMIVYTGFDAGANSTDPRPHADAAAAAFDAAAASLGSLRHITFESAPLAFFRYLILAPDAEIYATSSTIAGAPILSPESLYGYNTTPGGSRFVTYFGGDLTFLFNIPIQSFGAYFSGVQFDLEYITYEYDDGTIQTIYLPVPNLGGTGGITFFGFTDAGRHIASVTFNADSGNFADIVGIDDVRYVVVPETSSFVMAVVGLIGMTIGATRAQVHNEGLLASVTRTCKDIEGKET